MHISSRVGAGAIRVVDRRTVAKAEGHRLGRSLRHDVAGCEIEREARLGQ
jgi:hypothetical protein